MTRHFIQIIVIIVFIVAGIFLPFMPGDYDAFAITFSAMAQFLGISGLLLVLIGILWFIYEIKKRKGKDIKTYRFALATLYVSSLLAIAVATATFINNSRVLAIAILGLFVVLCFKIHRRIKEKKNEVSHTFNPIPVYLIIIPLIVVLIRFTFISKAAEFSRNTAIKQSEKIIRDIEIYYSNNGHYPVSMLSMWKD